MPAEQLLRTLGLRGFNTGGGRTSAHDGSRSSSITSRCLCRPGESYAAPVVPGRTTDDKLISCTLAEVSRSASARRLPRSAGCGSNVGGALTAPARISLALELHALALLQFVEDSPLDAGRVKEQLLTALVANEAEASIPNQPRDRPGFCHAAHIPSAPAKTPPRVGLLDSTGSPSVREWWPRLRVTARRPRWRSRRSGSRGRASPPRIGRHRPVFGTEG